MINLGKQKYIVYSLMYMTNSPEKAERGSQIGTKIIVNNYNLISIFIYNIFQTLLFFK